ncbi:beta-galactosidase [Sphingobium ummariense]
MANIDSRRTVIAPFILGQYFCDDAVDNPEVRNDNEAALFSASIGMNGAGRINRFLDSIGPKVSPSGRFSLGYTLNLPLLRYFTRVDGVWTLNVEALRHNIRTILDVDRDVVIYLSANHFTDANEELVRELSQDATNLMWGRDGPLPPDDYFNHMIVSWTLSDYHAPITRMREEAFRAAAAIISELPDFAQRRIVAVSVLGEVHDMFPDFVRGPSQTLPVTQTTDYSPVAIHGFRHWLEERFGRIDALNAELGSSYQSFAAVSPPSRNMFQEPVESVFQHVDLSAAGSISVYGWLYDQLQRPTNVDVYLDGIFQGEAEMGLSRTDVTDNNDFISDPNVGWRLDFDFRNVTPGIHAIDIVVRVRGLAPLHMARRWLTVRAADGAAPEPMQPVPDLMALYVPMSSETTLMGYADGPEDGRAVIHNPLASLWLEYRNAVVRRYFEHFAGIVISAGIDPALVHSHQMAPNLYGSWNSDLIALDEMQRNPAGYTHGVTLYGGTAFGQSIDRMMQRLGWERYAVNELHTIVPLDQVGYQDMFEHHYRNGATFLAPYYMSIVPDRLLSGSDLDKYLISPKNERCGSNLFWNAISNIMKL